jgi:homoserine O-acetyltransferase/O-succinyltransferase
MDLRLLLKFFMNKINTYIFEDTFKLESGRTIDGLQLGYNTFGTLNKEKDNVVWVVHALTANADPTEWWPGVVGDGFVIDPAKYFIICANNPGSPYGSTSPLSIDPRTGSSYYHDFPTFTSRDIATAFAGLRNALGIDKIKLLIGASLGGQISLEWSIIEPTIFENMTLIATNAKHSPWGIAFNESQRLAIEADRTWPENTADAGSQGLIAARSIALLSYRTSIGYNSTQKDDRPLYENYRAATYQRYQGEKLLKRYNAHSYYTVTKTMDSHNIGRGRESAELALRSIKANTFIIGITTDILFPIDEQKYLAMNIRGSKFIELFSSLGHDGFLTESEKVSDVISMALELTSQAIALQLF